MVGNNEQNDALLADIAANDSHHDFHHNIKEIMKYYQQGVNGKLEKEKIDNDEATTMGYVIDTLDVYDSSSSASSSSLVKNTRLSLHSDNTVKEPTNVFTMKNVNDIEYQVFKYRYKKGDEVSYKDLKSIMKKASQDDSGVFSNFNINGAVFVHDAASINIYNILFKKSPDENLELFFAHCPEISNDPAPKATLDTVSTYGSENVKYYSVIPSNRGDSVYNYILDPNGVYETEGRNIFNSTYQVKFTEFNVDKKKNMSTNVTYSDLNAKSTKIFEHDYKVKSRSSDTDTTISSVTSKINKLRNKSRSGKPLNDKEVFDLNTAYQMKRGGDQLQVCFAKKIHDRLFEEKGLIEFKTIGEQNEIDDLIKNKKITDVYFVTHDQIAAAYALFLGVSVIFTHTKPGVKTIMFYKSSKTINKELIERNKYDKTNLFFGNEDNFKEQLQDNTKTLELANQYDALFTLIKENAASGYLPENTLTKMSDIATFFINNGVNITIPENIKYEDIPSIKSTIANIIENKINYDKFLLEIIENGIVNGKGKITDCVNLIIKNPRRGKETFKKLLKFIHIFTHIINTYTINIDLNEFIEKTKTMLLDSNINEIVEIINSVFYYDRYINDIRNKNIPLLAYIYNKKLGGKTKEKKSTITGFDDIFKEANNEITKILNTRKQFNENDVKLYTRTYFSIVNSKDVATASVNPDEPSNYFYELKTYVANILDLVNTLRESIKDNNDNTVLRIYKTTNLFLMNFLNNDNNPYFTTSQYGGRLTMRLNGGMLEVLQKSLLEDNFIVLEYFLNEYNNENSDFYTNFYTKKSNGTLSNIKIDVAIKRIKNNTKVLLEQEQETNEEYKQLLTLSLINILISNALSETHHNAIITNFYAIYALMSGKFDYNVFVNKIVKENVYYLEIDDYIDKTEMLNKELFNNLFKQYVYNLKKGSSVINYKALKTNIIASLEEELNILIDDMNETTTSYDITTLVSTVKGVYEKIKTKYTKTEKGTDNIIYFIENHNIILTVLETLNDVLTNYQYFNDEFIYLSKVKEEKMLIYLNSLSDVKLITNGLSIIEYMSVFYHELEYLYDDANDEVASVLETTKTTIVELNKDMINKIYISKGYIGEIEGGKLVREKDTLKNNLEVLFDMYENDNYKTIDKLYIDKVILEFLNTKQIYMFKLLSDTRFKVLLFSFLYDVNSYIQLLELNATQQNKLLRDLSVLNFGNVFSIFKNLDNNAIKFMVHAITYDFIDKFVTTLNTFYINNIYSNNEIDNINKLKIYVDSNLINLLGDYKINVVSLYKRFDSNFFNINKNAYCGVKRAVELNKPKPVPSIEKIEIILPENDKTTMNDDNIKITNQLYTMFMNYYKNIQLPPEFNTCAYEAKRSSSMNGDYNEIPMKRPLLVAGYRKTRRNNKLIKQKRKTQKNNKINN